MISTFVLSLGCELYDPASGEPDPSGEIHLSDANNYSFQGDLDGPTTPVAELEDVSFSWAELDFDLQCHDFDPVEDVDTVSLMVFPRLSETEVEEGLALDTLQQVDLGVYLEFNPGSDTDGVLSDFTFFGTEADIQEELVEGSGTWLVVLNTGTQVGVGSRMFAFLEPTAGETNDHVDILDGCSVLDHTVDLDALRPAPVLAEGPWEADWSELTTNGSGVEFFPQRVSRVDVGRYAGDLAQLEAEFLDLELVAEELYSMDHPGGTEADLSELVDEQGRAFEGFQGEGTWLLALRCGTCSNPAPLFLTVLDPS